jgi:hypothetical protein
MLPEFKVLTGYQPFKRCHFLLFQFAMDILLKYFLIVQINLNSLIPHLSPQQLFIICSLLFIQQTALI